MAFIVTVKSVGLSENGEAQNFQQTMQKTYNVQLLDQSLVSGTS